MENQNQMTVTNAAVLPAGYRAGGVHCGIKPADSDLALILSDPPATPAGVFTTNRVHASCVAWCRARVAAGGEVRAILVNSGNANACTGETGARNTETLAASAARALACDAAEICVSSTGPIGVPLPMDRMTDAIPGLARSCAADGGERAARAMMTTDKGPKSATVEIPLGAATCRITGLAKGAGMIHPNMATMLGYILTDAAVDAAFLQDTLRAAVDLSFNRITVDGDQSTNDTVLLLANGAAGNQRLRAADPGAPAFQQAVSTVCLDLARQIVRDGEGASRLVTVDVVGAQSGEDADRIARAIGNSLLVKTSWAGGDPNWGRLLCAAGYAGAAVDPNTIDIRYDGIAAVCSGQAAPTPIETLRAVVGQDAFTITIDLHQGDAAAVLYASDTTEAYVRINVEE